MFGNIQESVSLKGIVMWESVTVQQGNQGNQPMADWPSFIREVWPFSFIQEKYFILYTLYTKTSSFNIVIKQYENINSG